MSACPTACVLYNQGLYSHQQFSCADNATLPEDAVVAGSTCSGDGVVWSHEASVHSQECSAHVVDGKWYAEGVHFAETLRQFIHSMVTMHPPQRSSFY